MKTKEDFKVLHQRNSLRLELQDLPLDVPTLKESECLFGSAAMHYLDFHVHHPGGFALCTQMGHERCDSKHSQCTE